MAPVKMKLCCNWLLLSAPLQVPSWQDVYPKLSMYHPFSNTDAQVANENPVFTEFRPHRLRNDYNGNWMGETEGEGPRSQTYNCSKYQLHCPRSLKDNIKHISEFFSVLHENKWSMHVKLESGQQDVCCLMYPTGLKS